jgi:hypothetical protein
MMILLAEVETTCQRNKFGTQRKHAYPEEHSRLTVKVGIGGAENGYAQVCRQVASGVDGGDKQESQFVIMQQRRSPKPQTIKEDDSNSLSGEAFA